MTWTRHRTSKRAGGMVAPTCVSTGSNPKHLRFLWRHVLDRHGQVLHQASVRSLQAYRALQSYRARPLITISQLVPLHVHRVRSLLLTSLLVPLQAHRFRLQVHRVSMVKRQPRQLLFQLASILNFTLHKCRSRQLFLGRFPTPLRLAVGHGGRSSAPEHLRILRRQLCHLDH